MCVGACALEVPPSPKVQFQAEMVLTAIPVGVNAAALLAQALWVVKSTVGLALMVSGLIRVSEQLLPVKVISLTL